MASNTVQYTILLNAVGDAFKKVSDFAFRLNNVADAVRRVTDKMQEFAEANQAQQMAETKLAQVMRNTMNASAAEVDSIKALAAAQQKLGVIGDEVQLAGAQELGTYLAKADSLKTLMPVMNDMLAQQYGLNATQEQATQIASMLGKVMDGQVGALSRYGYKFDEAQEKILKYGTEEQRVAVLADVVGAAVGGMNEALAQTPEGRMQQLQNSIGDIKERIGGLWVQLQAKLLPVMERCVKFVDNLISAVIRFRTPLLVLAGVIGTVAAAMALIALRAKIMAVWQGVVTTATALWTAVQGGLNLAILACPVTWIVAGIMALVAAIVLCATKVQGWGTLWKGVWGFVKNIAIAYIDSIKTGFNAMVNGLMIGIDKIKLGWYKFKNSLGLGDKAANNDAIKAINEDIEKRKEAIKSGADKVKKDVGAAKDSLGGISLSVKKGQKKTKSAFGLQDSLVGMGGTDAGIGGGGQTAKDTASAVATGGTRSTTINISLGKMIEQVVFNGTFEEGASQMEQRVQECLLRVLYAAEAAAV